MSSKKLSISLSGFNTGLITLSLDRKLDLIWHFKGLQNLKGWKEMHLSNHEEKLSVQILSIHWDCKEILDISLERIFAIL